MKHANIIKSIFAAIALLAAGISPERSEHCEAMSLEGYAWAEMETVGGCTLTDRINGGEAEVPT